MSQQRYHLLFRGLSHADANRAAEELRTFLVGVSPTLTVERHRPDPLTQDAGSMLVLILGTPAVVALTRALGNWLKMRNQVSLTIEDAETKIRLDNVTHQTAASVIEQWFAAQRSAPQSHTQRKTRQHKGDQARE